MSPGGRSIDKTVIWTLGTSDEFLSVVRLSQFGLGSTLEQAGKSFPKPVTLE